MTKIQVRRKRESESVCLPAVKVLFAAALSGGVQVPGGVWTQLERCAPFLRLVLVLVDHTQNVQTKNEPVK